MSKKIYIKRLFLIMIVSMVTMTACSKLDVIGNDSKKAYRELLEAIPNKVTNNQAGSWKIEAPDQSAAFLWSSDYNQTDTDVWMEVDIIPFLEAGLDITKLPKGMVSTNKLIVGQNLGGTSFDYEGEITPLNSMENLIRNDRELLGYHASLDHFGIDLSGGNMFEWAKDINTNDLDMVFVLDPEVFEEAGTDLDAIQGWIYGEVMGMNDKGKMYKVHKLLKPFDVK